MRRPAICRKLEEVSEAIERRGREAHTEFETDKGGSFDNVSQIIYQLSHDPHSLRKRKDYSEIVKDGNFYFIPRFHPMHRGGVMKKDGENYEVCIWIWGKDAEKLAYHATKLIQISEGADPNEC